VANLEAANYVIVPHSCQYARRVRGTMLSVRHSGDKHARQLVNLASLL